MKCSGCGKLIRDGETVLEFRNGVARDGGVPGRFDFINAVALLHAGEKRSCLKQAQVNTALHDAGIYPD